MKTQDSIKTIYNGVKFRSRTEARWALFFDKIGWGWNYEAIAIPLEWDDYDHNEVTKWYVPDFYLSDFKLPVEVKHRNFLPTKLDEQKHLRAIEDYGRLLLLKGPPDFNLYHLRSRFDEGIRSQWVMLLDKDKKTLQGYSNGEKGACEALKNLKPSDFGMEYTEAVLSSQKNVLMQTINQCIIETASGQRCEMPRASSKVDICKIHIGKFWKRVSEMETERGWNKGDWNLATVGFKACHPLAKRNHFMDITYAFYRGFHSTGRKAKFHMVHYGVALDSLMRGDSLTASKARHLLTNLTQR